MRASRFLDGLSNTFFVGEVIDGDREATQSVWSLSVHFTHSLRSSSNPLNSTLRGVGVKHNFGAFQADGAFSSRHTGGGFFVYGDGRVNFIEEHIDLDTYQALSTRAGQEVIQLHQN